MVRNAVFANLDHVGIIGWAPLVKKLVPDCRFRVFMGIYLAISFEEWNEKMYYFSKSLAWYWSSPTSIDVDFLNF